MRLLGRYLAVDVEPDLLRISLEAAKERFLQQIAHVEGRTPTPSTPVLLEMYQKQIKDIDDILNRFFFEPPSPLEALKEVAVWFNEHGIPPNPDYSESLAVLLDRVDAAIELEERRRDSHPDDYSALSRLSQGYEVR